MACDCSQGWLGALLWRRRPACRSLQFTHPLVPSRRKEPEASGFCFGRDVAGCIDRPVLVVPEWGIPWAYLIHMLWYPPQYGGVTAPMAIS